MAERLLAPFDVATLDREPSSVIGLAPDRTIAYVNPAYWEFARANGATWGPETWGVGASFFDAIPDVLAPFYDELLHRSRSTRAILEHDYECSSPEEERWFRLRVMPCAGDGFVLVHSAVRSVARAPAPVAHVSEYQHDGLVIQCSHCRRARRTGSSRAWDWVPEFVARSPARVSHGLCEPCRDYYFGDVPLR